MTGQHIENRSGDARYFIITPQLVWALCQDPHEFTLWSVVKMIAGDEGECYVRTEHLAALAMMSAGKVSQCRQRLIDIGLLKGEIRKDPGYPQPVWHLVIPDLWAANLEWREAHHGLRERIDLKAQQRAGVQEKRRKERAKKSLHLVKPSPDEGKPSPGETKKNHERTTPTGGGVLTEEENQALSDLTTLGVEPAKARKLAGTCDPGQVIGWAAYAEQAKGLDNPAGFVVAKLKAGDPAPIEVGNADDWRRFVEGEYADYIE